MDDNILKELDKYYTLSFIIAGELGRDLLHHVLIDFKNKKKLSGDDLYLYMSSVLKNEFYNKKSSFNKQYGRIPTIDFDIENTSGYDCIQINDILEQLIQEGYESKVNLFKDVMYKNTSVAKIAEEMEVSRMYVYRNYINFVKHEIENRYEFE